MLKGRKIFFNKLAGLYNLLYCYACKLMKTPTLILRIVADTEGNNFVDDHENKLFQGETELKLINF